MAKATYVAYKTSKLDKGIKLIYNAKLHLEVLDIVKPPTFLPPAGIDGLARQTTTECKIKFYCSV